MPKNKVSDPITDQEIAFARLVLSGAMTDRQAAEAVGLNPDSAAYTKSKPRVRAYMLEHRAAVQEQVLARLWEIANLSPEMTRGSITGQVKAISMIIAMQNFIPNRHAVSSEKKSAPGSVPEAPSDPGPSLSTFADRVSPSEAAPRTPYVPLFTSVPDLGVSFSTIKNPFVHPR
jgi:hypothetical protein